MRIDGQWLVCDGGVVRPVMSGDMRTADGSWEQCEFLVDTGADRTVLSVVTLAKLRLQPLAMPESLSGVGGLVAAVIVETQLHLTCEDGSNVMFRGQEPPLPSWPHSISASWDVISPGCSP